MSEHCGQEKINLIIPTDPVKSIVPLTVDQTETGNNLSDDLCSTWTPIKAAPFWKPIKVKLKTKKEIEKITETQKHTETTNIKMETHSCTHENTPLNIFKNITHSGQSENSHGDGTNISSVKPELTYKYRKNTESNYLYESSNSTLTHEYDNPDNRPLLKNTTSSFNIMTCAKEINDDTDSEEELRKRLKKLNRKYNIIKMDHLRKRERKKIERLMGIGSEDSDDDDERHLSKRKSRKKRAKKSKRRPKLINFTINYYQNEKDSHKRTETSESEEDTESTFQKALKLRTSNNLEPFSKRDNSGHLFQEVLQTTKDKSDIKHHIHSIVNIDELKSTLYQSTETPQQQLENLSSNQCLSESKISINEEIKENEDSALPKLCEDNLTSNDNPIQSHDSPIIISDNDSDDNMLKTESKNLENPVGDKKYKTIEEQFLQLFGTCDDSNDTINNRYEITSNSDCGNLMNILKFDCETKETSIDTASKNTNLNTMSCDDSILPFDKVNKQELDVDQNSHENNTIKKENECEKMQTEESFLPSEDGEICSIPFLENEKNNIDSKVDDILGGEPKASIMDDKNISNLKVYKSPIRFSSPNRIETSPIKTIRKRKRRHSSGSSEDSESKIDSLEDKRFTSEVEKKTSAYLSGSFKMQSFIRNGRYSKIYVLSESGSRRKYAIKIAKTQRGFLNNMLIKNSRRMNSEYDSSVIKMFRTFCLNKQWCSIMEYCSRNLLQALTRSDKSFHIDHIQILAKQLISALTFLRHNSIVHSDINPRHILLSNCDQTLKLSGFDEAFSYQSIHLKPNVGSVNYRAPEIILGYQKADSNIDIWSSAVILFEMATKCQLFHGNNNNSVLYKMLRILGSIPNDMLNKCIYKSYHFRGKTFMKQNAWDKKSFYSKFEKTNCIAETINKIYKKDWKNTRSSHEQVQDAIKIQIFQDMLEKMLDLHPIRRLRVEFIPKNPFISYY